MRPRPEYSAQAGFSLVGVLVAVGISGALALLFSQMMKNQFDAQGRLFLRDELASTRRSLMERVDCAKTLAPYMAGAMPVCPAAGVLIEVKDSQGRTLITNTNPGSTSGKWTLRASCAPPPASTTTPNTAGLVIQAARPTPTSNGITETNPANFFKDPMTNKALSWNPLKADLFPPQTRLCARALTPPTQTCSNSGAPCKYTGDGVAVRTTDLVKTTLNGCSTSLFSGGIAVRSGSLANVASVASPTNPDPYAPNLYIDFWDQTSSMYHWQGTAMCDTGWHAIGGGANCQSGLYGVPLASHVFQDPGQGGKPVGWYSDCCGVPIVPTATSTPNGVYAICVPD